MVLDEASSGSMPEDAVNSEQAHNAPQGGYNLDPNKFPQPLNFFPGLSFTDMWLKNTVRDIQSYTVHYAGLLGRPPTQAEVEAYSYHLADKNRITANGTQAGICWGFWRTWATRKEYNWPLIQPYKKYANFNPNKFLGLEGQQALIARHTARIVAWSFWGSILGLLIFDNYGSIRAISALVKDDRLQALNEARDRNRKLRAQGQAANGPHPSPPPVNAQGDDSGSSTGEGWSFSGSAGFSGEGQASTRPDSQWSTTPAPDPSPQDDASPTGGLGLWDDSSESASTESSWDRIRQHSAPTSPTAQPSRSTSSENEWISPEASSQQPQQKVGAWDKIRQQNQQGAPPRQKSDDDDSWWK